MEICKCTNKAQQYQATAKKGDTQSAFTSTLRAPSTANKNRLYQENKRLQSEMRRKKIEIYQLKQQLKQYQSTPNLSASQNIISTPIDSISESISEGKDEFYSVSAYGTKLIFILELKRIKKKEFIPSKLQEQIKHYARTGGNVDGQRIIRVAINFPPHVSDIQFMTVSID